MSLDVYLTMPGAQGEARQAIFVREDGSNREISRKEWDKLHPDREPVTVQIGGDGEEVYSANITHNLNKMAGEAGIYEALWRPEEIGVKKAKDLIGRLSDGLGTLQSDPERFKKSNPENGWGNYEVFVQFVAKYLEACIKWPEADVRASR